MDKQNLMPHQAQPISRITTGQLPAELAELSEEILAFNSVSVLASSGDKCGAYNKFGPLPYKDQKSTWAHGGQWLCSYEGDDAE